MGECKFFSMLRPPFQRLVDSTKLTNTNSQSDSMSNSIIFLSPTSSGEDIKAESVMDSSDYTRVEPMSSLNRCEDIEERRERKTGYFMSREQTDILTNIKEEEEDGERQSVKMEGEDGVRDEEELWKKEEKERDEQREGHFIQIFKCENNEGESEFRQQEGVDLSALVTSCLLMQPRVLIHRLEIADISLPVSSPPHPMAYKRDMGARSPWRRHELSPLRGNGSLRQKKGQPVTRKRKTIGQLERPLKLQTSSSENGICTEASLCSPITPSRNQDTGQTVEMASQAFCCSQCPFVDTEEVNLHQHIETVHPKQLNGTGDGADNPLPPSSKHQHPKPPDTAPTPKPSHTGTPTAHTCSQCGKSFPQLGTLKIHQRIHTGERPYHCCQCWKSFGQLGHLKLHQRTHTGERPYHCSQCGKSFGQSGHLKQHQQTHTGDRPYHCSQCGKSFIQADKLKIHQRTHTGERPYHCSQCGKNFAQSYHLKQHQRTHTGERPYHCSQCGKSFVQSYNLKLHQQTHTGHRPYHCSQCGKNFTQADKLKVHQKTHTGECPYHCSQ